MLIVAVLVVDVPRLLFCTAAGMVFGFWPGLIAAQIGTLLGTYSAFLVIRWSDRDHALRRFPRLNRLAGLVQGQGVVGVILLRQLPLHGTITNLCLGLSRVKHRDYLIGSAIGMLTEAIPATLIGTGMVKGSFTDSVRYIVMAVIAASVIWMVAAWWLQKIRRYASGIDAHHRSRPRLRRIPQPDLKVFTHQQLNPHAHCFQHLRSGLPRAG